MPNKLIVRNDVKLLIGADDAIAAIERHIEEVEALHAKVNEFYKNLLDAAPGEGTAIDAEVKALQEKIGYKIVGVPFTNHDAELYVLDRKINIVKVTI